MPPRAVKPAKPGPGSTALFVLAAVVGAAFAGSIASSHSALLKSWSILWQLTGWGAAWIVGTIAALRLPRRHTLSMIVAAAVVVRLMALAGPPTTSDDLYRYAWDGRVQTAGVDPYRYPPAASQLGHLREPWLFPGRSGCAALLRPTPCTRINRPLERTIYPPVAEAWFTAVYRLSGIGGRHKAWQVAGLLVDLLTIGLLVVALRRWGRDDRWVALYALCPAAVLEFVSNAHVDGLAVAFMVAALVISRPPPHTGTATATAASPSARSTIGRDVAIGALIGAAALVKVYPALLLVALIGLPRPHPWLSVARATAAALGLGAITYLPHVAAVGSKVLGFLPGYLREEHYTKGGRFLLAGALGLQGSLATAAAVLGLSAAVAWVVWRRPDPPAGAVVLFGALLLATTPVQPWYAVSLVALGALAVRPRWAAVTAAGYPYYFAVILDSRRVTGIGRAAYGAALVAVVASWLITRRRGKRTPGRRPAVADTAADTAAGTHAGTQAGAEAGRHRRPPDLGPFPRPP